MGFYWLRGCKEVKHREECVGDAIVDSAQPELLKLRKGMKQQFYYNSEYPTP